MSSPPPAYPGLPKMEATAPPPPPPNFGPAPPPNQNTTIVVQPTLAPGAANPTCDRCRLGYINHDYCTCCGILWSILLFPFGLICLCCCRDTWCTHCGRR